jgi:hypothetical protein
MSDSNPSPPAGRSKYIDEVEASPDFAVGEAERLDVVMTFEESAALFGTRGARRSADGTESGPTLGGIYKATCVNAIDPLLRGRIQVTVPTVAGASAVWAQSCLPPAWSGELPAPGDGIWVMFEGGDAQSPVWLGVRQS